MWVEKTKNGKFKFIERYEDFLTGKQKKVSITLDKDTNQNRKLALNTLNKMINENQSADASEDITLEQLIKKYLEYQKEVVKGSTYKRNTGSMNTIMKILEKDILVQRLNAQFIKDRFLKSKRDKVGLNELRTRLNALLNWGYENDYVADVSFMKKFKKFKEEVTKKERIQDKYLEPEELSAILKRMEDTEMWDWYYVTNFLVLSGLRIGELISLQNVDVSNKRRIISVTKTFDTNNKIITTPKSASSIRDVYIQDELLAFLKKMQQYMKLRKLRYGYSTDNDLFFPSTDGNFVHYDAFRKYLKETTLAIIGRQLTPHALRHTHASIFLAQGVSVDAISRRLGHEDSKITREIYLHVTKALQAKDRQEIMQVKIR